MFLENFRDGQLEKQGLDADELRRKYPHLIITGHKGFLSGPYEHRPALDEVVQMMSGLAAMTGTMDKPQRVGSSANDIMGGMFGAIAILAALYQKRGGTEGADIRIGLFENCLFLVAQHMVEYEMTGIKPRSMPEREHAWPIYDIFETAGGERIFIGVVTEGHWQSFCREFGLHVTFVFPQPFAVLRLRPEHSHLTPQAQQLMELILGERPGSAGPGH